MNGFSVKMEILTLSSNRHFIEIEFKYYLTN
jgi:hypothetical protein